ncbi:MAG: hypothetical protein KGV51_04235 [Moraxellaceae bacterium]|nr:hypothetical protein [Moraxellaceae bacterium]
MLLSIITLNLTACWQVTVVKPPVEDTQQENERAEHKKKIKHTAKKEKNVVEKLFAKKEEKKPQNVQTELLPINSNLGSIDYDVNSWSNSQVEPLDIETITNNPELIAKVVSVDENSLDFASHKATKYRFMANNAPYFDMVNSYSYLEIGWHFANINDSDEVKETSINHAKTAYKFARQLMGAEGGQMVADMLAGHVIKDKQVKGIYIALAKCEFYSCMLVIEKNKVIQEEQDEENLEEITKDE